MAVKRHPKGSIITLSQALQWMHFGDPKGVRDGFGGYIDERGEVALLSRNIVITGTDEPAPYNYEGGHFMIFMTRVPQTVEGVEFYKMGQQGKLGRYSIHLHVCRKARRRIVIRKNTIHRSKQVMPPTGLQHRGASRGRLLLLGTGCWRQRARGFHAGMRAHRPLTSVCSERCMPSSPWPLCCSAALWCMQRTRP